MLRLPTREHREVFLGVIDRNLQAGVGKSTLDKVKVCMCARV
jgi:hypothetical protein